MIWQSCSKATGPHGHHVQGTLSKGQGWSCWTCPLWVQRKPLQTAESSVGEGRTSAVCFSRVAREHHASQEERSLGEPGGRGNGIQCVPGRGRHRVAQHSRIVTLERL